MKLHFVLFFAAAMSLAGCMTPGTDIDFGDDKSEWARDGECDDPRFKGVGTHSILLKEDAMHDATDCRTLFYQGKISLR